MELISYTRRFVAKQAGARRAFPNAGKSSHHKSEQITVLQSYRHLVYISITRTSLSHGSAEDNPTPPF